MGESAVPCGCHHLRRLLQKASAAFLHVLSCSSQEAFRCDALAPVVERAG